MKLTVTLPAALALSAVPMLAHAQQGAPHIIMLYALGGGAVGGFIGALLACWWCNRKRGAEMSGHR